MKKVLFGAILFAGVLSARAQTPVQTPEQFFGFRIGANSNHSAGLFLLTGNFTVEIGPTARNVTDARGSERDICAELT